MRHKVILDPHGRQKDIIFSPEDQARLSSMADILWGRDDPMPASEIEAVCGETEAIISGTWRHGDVDRFPRLRAFLGVSGGFPRLEALDYEACFRRGVRVLTCAPAFAPAVAEMGLGLAIAASRQIVSNDAAFRRGAANWSHTDCGGTFTLYDKPVGFIGFGSLARALKPLLDPFGCRIRVYDPWMTDTYLRTQGVEPANLNTIMSESRFIFVLAVPTSPNRALLGRNLLELIRPDAVFVLLSRSHVVDFDALTGLLADGRFTGAIDVFPAEPLEEDHPLRSVPNVILSSHRAGAISEALLKVGRIVTNDLEAILAGLPPREMQVAEMDYLRLRGL